MSAPLPVRPLVPWLVLTSAQDLISDLLRFLAELRVSFASVEEHGGIRLLEQGIEIIGHIQPRRVCEHAGLDGIGECIVPDKGG